MLLYVPVLQISATFVSTFVFMLSSFRKKMSVRQNVVQNLIQPNLLQIVVAALMDVEVR